MREDAENLSAVAILFPQGERMFIAVAREVGAKLDLKTHPVLATALRAFTAQDAIHTAQHVQYNAILCQQGFELAGESSSPFPV